MEPEDGTVEGLVRLRATGTGRSLLWAGADAQELLAPSASMLRDERVVARMLPDMAADRLAGSAGWKPALRVTTPDGREIASIRRSPNGDVVLPFSPDDAVKAFWSESYRNAGSQSGAKQLARTVALRGYYAARPLVPRRAQIRLRQAFSAVQGRTRFPAWPVETALRSLYDLVFSLLREISEEPVPRLAPWPDGKRWALVLTHDVETELGYRNIHVLRDVERERGFRSSWNFVPLRYDVGDDVVDELWGDGFEVGVHGLYHDGRDLESRAMLMERLPRMQEWGARWRSVGFRSPATHRSWELMPLLPFDYDSSSPDTDPYEPRPGGCLSWLPFFNEQLVELPITLPQDHTLFVILGKRDEGVWVEKTDEIRRANGMALVITHPDYMLEPALVAAYHGFLRRFADDETLWKALPKDVAAWWRRRDASTIERADGDWLVVGPAAGEGRIELVDGGPV